jgi:hypothetical protein
MALFGRGESGLYETHPPLFPNLTSLTAENYEGDCLGRLMRAIPSLNKLFVDDEAIFTHEPMQLANIQELTIKKYYFADQLPKALARLPSLHTLTLYGVNVKIGMSYEIEPNCRSLRTIMFDSCKFTIVRRNRKSDAWYPIAKYVTSLSFINCDFLDKTVINRIVSSCNTSKDKVRVVKHLTENCNHRL